MPGMPKGFLRSLIYLWSSAVSACLHHRAVSLSILYSSPSSVLPYCSSFTICILLGVSVVVVQPLGLEQSLLAWVLEMVFPQGSYPSLPWQQNSDSHVWVVAGTEFPAPLLLVADFFMKSKCRILGLRQSSALSLHIFYFYSILSGNLPLPGTRGGMSYFLSFFISIPQN